MFHGSCGDANLVGVDRRRLGATRRRLMMVLVAKGRRAGFFSEETRSAQSLRFVLDVGATATVELL